MTTRPGTQITARTSPPSRGAPTDTGVWFVAGLTQKGLTSRPLLIQNMNDYDLYLGDRVTYGVLYDALETFFREGGNKAYVARVVGTTPTYSARTFADGAGTPINTMTVKANSPGVWGADLRVAILAGDVSGFKVQVSTTADGILETSGDLASKAEAIAWAGYSNYITITDLGVGANPAPVAAANLTGGTDDQGTIADAHWLTALNLFSRDYGPGQVSAPGRTTAAGHLQLTAHAAANNRVAVLDGADTTSRATLQTAASNARDANARYGAMFAPWVQVPGLTANTLRDVPPSALVAGLIARNDSKNNPNSPAAGVNGQAQYALDVKATFSDADRDLLNTSGVNVVRLMYGGVRLYGYRTLTNPTTDVEWVQLSASRLYMAIAAKADAIAEQFLFAQLDGNGLTMAGFKGALMGMLVDYYADGSLYGTTPSEAFVVDVGESVNTPETIADGQLRAVVGLRISPFAELVTIEIVKVSVTEAVA